VIEGLGQMNKVIQIAGSLGTLKSLLYFRSYKRRDSHLRRVTPFADFLRIMSGNRGEDSMAKYFRNTTLENRCSEPQFSPTGWSVLGQLALQITCSGSAAKPYWNNNMAL